ncbi:MAG TPA: serine/threonine-protein kinase, partial [Polyangiales bacterium]|nr:serine/threonine-protein kinase [Polyangiales bacterium]
MAGKFNSNTDSILGYEELSKLGRGGAGEVFLVRDRESGELLALKRLFRADDQSIQRLKREFRTLAAIDHPNLVKLYELSHDARSAYFTMEYLKGQELREYLDYASPRGVANDNNRHQRVLSAFYQLAGAVTALHRTGVLHRDLKPSNVMVVGDRVVVLDFGIALEVGENAPTVTQEGLLTGTPAYMAPEQSRGEHLGQGNDWYAFGAMLYEALTGRLPIEGNLRELLSRKSNEDPPPIGSLVPGLSPEVRALCTALLSRIPEQRPQGEQVLSVLAEYAATSGAVGMASNFQPPTATELLREHSLFGRKSELAALWAAFRSVQQGDFAAVHIAGESGSGKSALVQQFTEEVERDLAFEGRPLILRSRCYERESLPFKALDGAIDALVAQLMREDDVAVSHVLPVDLAILAQLFPALHRLAATKRLLSGQSTAAAVPQARARAETALRDLLCRLSDQRSLILWIDDLQWGDLDSTNILSSWLASPLPHVLLVMSYRSEEIATSPCLALVRQRLTEHSECQHTLS